MSNRVLSIRCKTLRILHSSLNNPKGSQSLESPWKQVQDWRRREFVFANPFTKPSFTQSIDFLLYLSRDNNSQSSVRILHFYLIEVAIYLMFSIFYKRPCLTAFRMISWSYLSSSLYSLDLSSRRRKEACLSNQFLQFMLASSSLLIDANLIFLVFIINPTNLITAILKTAILSPICCSSLGRRISTFSSCSSRFSIFWRSVSLFLQFFWEKRCSINAMWSSQVGGSFGNSLFLN